MYVTLAKNIQAILEVRAVSEERKTVLQPLIDFVQRKVNRGHVTSIIFICTHNSRRSLLSQVWAQVASMHYKIPNVHCFSGGTEETALYPLLIDTLNNQGFRSLQISESANPVYAIKYSEQAQPIIGFSKVYDSCFNPVTGFVAVMTCSEADGECPFISGAEQRIPVTYEDPKVSDGTSEQEKIYAERSLQIAAEMFYVFSMIKK